MPFVLACARRASRRCGADCGLWGLQRAVGAEDQIRYTQCAMACGGDAATNALRLAAAGRGGGAVTGTGTVAYSAVRAAAGTLNVPAWSLCWPALQCSAHRLAAAASMAPTMSSQLAIGAAGAAAASASRATASRPGHAYAATASCANNSAPATPRAN